MSMKELAEEVKESARNLASRSKQKVKAAAEKGKSIFRKKRLW